MNKIKIKYDDKGRKNKEDLLPTIVSGKLKEII